MENRIKTGSQYDRYFARKWLVLYDGGSDQWLYVAKSGSGSTYVFLEIIDLVAYCGRDATDQWCAEVASVDIDTMPLEQIQGALSYCGVEDDPPDLRTESGCVALAEMLFSYGAKSPLWGDCSGNPREHASEDSKDFRSLRAEARRQAEAMLDDSNRDHVLDTKIVNGIGQTSREYSQGTAALWDTLRKIRDKGDDATPEQKLVLKMYGKCNTTLGAGPVPSDLRD